jgi:hypothetical protein
VYFLGLEITGDHARLLLAILGGFIGVLGFAAGRWSRHRNRVRFRHEDLVTSSILVEFYGIQLLPDANQRLDFVTQGGSMTLETFFFNPELIASIRRAAAKHPGLLRLPGPVAHRMMMTEGENHITGLDPRANVDFAQGRPTRDDELLIGFAAYREGSHDNNGLHDQVARLILMVVSPSLVERLADPDYVAQLRVPHTGYAPRRDRLHDFAREWQRLQSLPQATRSGGSDSIWQITVRTAMPGT